MDDLDKKIAALGVKRSYKKDAFLFLAEEDARGFFYVLRGEVRIFRMGDSGREIEIVRLRLGDFFGEAVAIVSGKFPAFARAAKDTEVLYFERPAVLRSIQSDPAVAEFFLVLLANKCILLNERIETLNLRTVRQRLAQYLIAHCAAERSCTIDLTIKKSELAEHLGTISETLSRTFQRMERDGLIEVRGKCICVLDCDKLRQELNR
jgi:CRP/FNR family transcriptional regulator, dissimilatory nitrate respiration regulator